MFLQILRTAILYPSRQYFTNQVRDQAAVSIVFAFAMLVV
jgi:hypothetical protein